MAAREYEMGINVRKQEMLEGSKYMVTSQYGRGGQGEGGVRETGEERAGGGISTMTGSGREIQKGKLLLFVTAYFQSKKRTQERFLTSI